MTVVAEGDVSLSSPPWVSAGPDGQVFLTASIQTPGWYWVLRPHHSGPGQYDPITPVVCPIYVFPDGRISSPLADFRERLPEHICPKDAEGLSYPSYFAGPIVPGTSSGLMQVKTDGAQTTAEGTPPPAPGWYWCKTNPEAPLLHVDEHGLGPIYISPRSDGEIHVWSAASIGGRPIDVGELGFSEPLTSPGGVIDASGELNRHTIEFFGEIALPQAPPTPLWGISVSSTTSTLSLSEGVCVLNVQNLERARKFYELLGFGVKSSTENTLDLEGLGTKLRLSTVDSAVLHLTTSGTDTLDTLNQLGVSSTSESQHIRLRDPDGNTIIIHTS
ncbi:MAG: VOC family protein [Myxococcales bacterium]|nr:VOC family protein [Myxococcales bacterium]